MTVNHREMLSALVDGQLKGQELTQAIAHISNDPSARAEFLRMQYASDVMHGYTRAVSQRPVDLAQQLSAALSDEPVYHQNALLAKAKVLAFPKTFWKQATGLAMAASFGALAVVGVMNQPGYQNVPLASAENTINPTTQVNRWTVGEPEIEDRLNNYLVDHNEYAGGAGMFSYGRVVSYGTEQ
ncbi:MAG TPA: sigma-E factor negative regulatory protein [Methylophaga sp.]|nr:sigma-E factor negative regulatory protein [Methylophaga sp.]